VRALAALGPKMLALAADRAIGAHPYFVPPEHTAIARDVMGPNAWLMPEQMVVLETDASEAREIARRAMSIYLTLPNYVNNLRRLGFTDEDFADAPTAWSTRSWCGATRARSGPGSTSTSRRAPITSACRCCATR
jgi:probable F420-dependent oxidoreductase